MTKLGNNADLKAQLDKLETTCTDGDLKCLRDALHLTSALSVKLPSWLAEALQENIEKQLAVPKIIGKGKKGNTASKAELNWNEYRRWFAVETCIQHGKSLNQVPLMKTIYAAAQGILPEDVPVVSDKELGVSHRRVQKAMAEGKWTLNEYCPEPAGFTPEWPGD